MARKEGSRNREYEARRHAILVAVRERLVRPGEGRASLRDMAQAAGVSLPTLRHYFPGRDAVLLGVLALARTEGEPHLEHLARPTEPFASSVRTALDHIHYGFISGVGELHSIGLTEGLRHPAIGPGFVDAVLEPSLDALARRLGVHIAAGEMRAVDPRHAALMLIAPISLLMLHQTELDGAVGHPMDVRAFLADHAAAFVRAFQA
jgi:AcrR family transcriptional regulator